MLYSSFNNPGSSISFYPTHIPKQHVQERMSSAYISAVAARSGCTCTPTGQGEDYGADFYLTKIRRLGNSFAPASLPVVLQAKSSINATRANGVVKYTVKGKAYNKIVHSNSEGFPTALIVYRMPSDHDKWLYHDHDRLELATCAYWSFLMGAMIPEGSSKVVSIPESQRFCLDNMDEVFEQAKVISLNAK